MRSLPAFVFGLPVCSPPQLGAALTPLPAGCAAGLMQHPQIQSHCCRDAGYISFFPGFSQCLIPSASLCQEVCLTGRAGNPCWVVQLYLAAGSLHGALPVWFLKINSYQKGQWVLKEAWKQQQMFPDLAGWIFWRSVGKPALGEPAASITGLRLPAGGSVARRVHTALLLAAPSWAWTCPGALPPALGALWPCWKLQR